MTGAHSRCDRNFNLWRNSVTFNQNRLLEHLNPAKKGFDVLLSLIFCHTSKFLWSPNLISGTPQTSLIKGFLICEFQKSRIFFNYYLYIYIYFFYSLYTFIYIFHVRRYIKYSDFWNLRYLTTYYIRLLRGSRNLGKFQNCGTLIKICNRDT